MPNQASLTDSLAAIVRDKIREQGHSINGLADRTGIPFSTLRRRVTGKTPFTTEELEAIATEFSTTLEVLIATAHASRTAAAA